MNRLAKPLLAAFLAILSPGLGHVYLRKWGRAFGWFLLFYATFLLVVPEAMAQSVELTIESYMSFVSALPDRAILALSALVMVNVIDAFWLAYAEGESDSTEETLQCPDCNKEIEADIEFCPWCGSDFDPTSR